LALSPETVCDVRNNLIWGFTQWGTTVRQGGTANVVNNYYSGSGSKPLYVFENGAAYVSGNYSPNGTDVDANGNRSTPFSAPAVATTDAITAAQQIVLQVGARGTSFGLDIVDQGYLSQISITGPVSSTPPPSSVPPPGSDLGACVNPSGGYEGFGRNTTGGAGQSVYHVTNLNNSGAGSLRDALSSGNRCVVFDVGGTISLSGEITAKSNTTIDGFTAPSPGITLRNAALGVYNNSNVIIRGIRHRYAPAGIDGLFVYGSQNVVIDHVSVSDFGDGALDVTRNSKDVTVSWSILAHGNPDHDMVSLNAYYSTRITDHHNLYMNGRDRQPMCTYDQTNLAHPSEINCDIRNNLIWGFYQWGTTVRHGAYANVINNYYYGSGSTAVFIAENGVAYVNGNYSKNGTNIDAYGNRSTPFTAVAPVTTDARTAAQAIKAGAGARSPNFGLDSKDQGFMNQISL